MTYIIRGASYHPNIPLNGLVLALDAGNVASYPGSGTKWNDLIGNLSNSFINGPSFNNQKLGSIAFDGTNDYVSIPTSLSVTLSNSASIVIWFKLNSTFNSSANTCHGLFDIYLNNNIRGLVYLSNDSGHVGKIGSILFSGGIKNKIYTQQNTWDTEWKQLVATRQNNDFKIFINGIKQPITLITSSSFGAFPSTASAISLGTSLYTFGSTNPACPFNGRIAQCLLYNRILTSNEIFKSYSELKSRYV